MTHRGKMWAVALLAAAVHAAPATAQTTDATAAKEPRETGAVRAPAAELDETTLPAFLGRVRPGGWRGGMGLGLRREKTPTATLDPSVINRPQARARAAETARSGIDDKIVIPTTTLIIGLLVLIVILVAD